MHLVIWHETYTATQGSYEIIYVNMSAVRFGMCGYAAYGIGKQAIGGRPFMRPIKILRRTFGAI
ncbi:monooxygenase family protein [Candidatus Methylospira mobilis]|uniref:monooxygenase family protein n=1 Tax=Candidatus Methylospira mobilis TaxID=1808979 RepID=UPI00387E3F23